eukprot:8245959-Alexandrium_andersonii.AAC.1
MSASLVGSEMCIRDRSTRAPGRATRPSTSSPDRTRWARDAPPCEEVQSVSYTHLTLPTICSV